MDDAAAMSRAASLGRLSRRVAPPNPWVGAVVVGDDGTVLGEGRTQAPGGAHAEIEALAAAGPRAAGATLVVTLEPCAHHGRTPPCVDAIAAAGVRRVVMAITDPDPWVHGAGERALAAAGVAVAVGVGADEVRRDLAPYLWHRETGRPYVVLKVAATLDGRVAMGDGSSQWITSAAARADGHALRADSQAVLVGAGTVRADDPQLTARLAEGTWSPLRVVLGHAPPTAKVHPCMEYVGALAPLLRDLGERGVLQLLVEGGPYTASSFVEAGLVNRVVWYAAPAFAGAATGRGALDRLSTASMDALRRGTIVAVEWIGEDVKVEVEL